jgi:molybdopterin synthase sulfur carrier subunit
VSHEVRLPTVMRAGAGGAPSVTGDGATVGELFEALIAQHPGLRDHLLDPDGQLHKFVNVYVNDDDIRYMHQLDTKIGDGDTVSILPAVAGG